MSKVNASTDKQQHINITAVSTALFYLSA